MGRIGRMRLMGPMAEVGGGEFFGAGWLTETARWRSLLRGARCCGALAAAAPVAEGGGPAPEEELRDEAGVEPDHAEIIAQIVEMGNAAVGFGEVAAGGGKVERGDTGPDHADGDLGIEIVTAGEARGAEGGDDGKKWIHAEAEERVVDAGSEEFEADEADGKFATLEAELRGLGAEDGFAEDECVGLRGGGGHEVGDAVGGVLAVGVHDERVREAGGGGGLGAGEDGGAFAAIGRADDDAEVRVL